MLSYIDPSQDRSHLPPDLQDSGLYDPLLSELPTNQGNEEKLDSSVPGAVVRKGITGTVQLNNGLFSLLHSDVWWALFIDWAVPIDTISTFSQRWPGVGASIRTGTSDVGPVLRYLSQHHTTAGLVLGGEGAFSLLSLGLRWYLLKKQQRRDEAKLKKIADEIRRLSAYSGVLEEFNEIFNRMRQGNPELDARYSQLELVTDDDGELQLRYTFNPGYEAPRQGKAGVARKTIYGSAIAYWLFWISAACFTAMLATGIVGVAAALAFVLPPLIIAPLPLTAIYNWFKNRNKNRVKNPDQSSADLAACQRKAELDALSLMSNALEAYQLEQTRKAIQQASDAAQREVANARKYVKNQELRGSLVASTQHFNALLQRARRPTLGGIPNFAPNRQLTAEFLTASGLISEPQYDYWIFSDFCVTVIPQIFAVSALSVAGILFFPVVAWVLLAAGLALTAYSVYKKHQELQPLRELQEHNPLPPGTTPPTLEQLQQELRDRQRVLAELQQGLSAFAQNKIPGPLVLPAESPPTRWERFAKFFFGIGYPLNNVTTGGFTFRMFFTAGGAVCLALAPLAIPFPPVAIGLLVFAGLFHAGLKFWQDCKAEKNQAILTTVSALEETNAKIAKLADAYEQGVQAKNDLLGKVGVEERIDYARKELDPSNIQVRRCTTNKRVTPVPELLVGGSLQHTPPALTQSTGTSGTGMFSKHERSNHESRVLGKKAAKTVRGTLFGQNQQRPGKCGSFDDSCIKVGDNRLSPPMNYSRQTYVMA